MHSLSTLSRFVSLLLLILSLNFSSAYSLEEDNYRNLNTEIIEELVISQDTSIVSVEENERIFIDSDRLIPSQKGMLLQTDQGEYVRIPILLSNSQGSFTCLSNNTPSNEIIHPVIECRNCHKKFTPTIFNGGRCIFCGYQN